MAKFTNIKFEALGNFIREMIKDPAKMEVFKTGSQEQMKDVLKGFMEPVGKSWDQITIAPHFDDELTVNIAFPFTGDVEQTVQLIAPENAPGEDYFLPTHYSRNPNEGTTDDEKKINRLRAYSGRIGDYVMSRCK